MLTISHDYIGLKVLREMRQELVERAEWSAQIDVHEKRDFSARCPHACAHCMAFAFLRVQAKHAEISIRLSQSLCEFEGSVCAMFDRQDDFSAPDGFLEVSLQRADTSLQPRRLVKGRDDDRNFRRITDWHRGSKRLAVCPASGQKP